MTKTMTVVGMLTGVALAACGGGMPDAQVPGGTPGAGGASTTSGSTSDLKPFQKEALDHFEQDIKSNVEAANKACGITIKVTSDFSAYKEEEWSGQSISGRCGSVLDGIAAVCGKSHYKPEVAKNISEVKCMFGGAGGSDAKPNLNHSGKTFTFKMHKDNANLSETVAQVLQNKLDGK